MIISFSHNKISPMKIQYLIFAFSLFIFLFTSCNDKNECEDILCTTGPSPLYLQLIDANTSENLIESGVIDVEDLTILNENNSPHKFQYIPIHGDYFLEISSEKFDDSPKINSIYVNDSLISEFIFQYEIVSENCCSFPKMIHFEAIDHEYISNNNDFKAIIYINR